jgi:hypothetical protein
MEADCTVKGSNRARSKAMLAVAILNADTLPAVVSQSSISTVT